MQAITTKYLPCTNTRGSRIKATAGNGRKSVTIPYPHELSGEQCHRAAVIELCKRLDWHGTLVSGGTETGYVFVFTDLPYADPFTV